MSITGIRSEFEADVNRELLNAYSGRVTEIYALGDEEAIEAYRDLYSYLYQRVAANSTARVENTRNISAAGVAATFQWWIQGWRGDGAWLLSSTKDKVLYEVGQKTLSVKSTFQLGGPDYLFTQTAVTRGKLIVDKFGWWKALWPENYTLGAGITFSTGPTPIFRAITVLGGAAYGGWWLKSEKPPEPEKEKEDGNR